MTDTKDGAKPRQLGREEGEEGEPSSFSRETRRSGTEPRSDSATQEAILDLDSAARFEDRGEIARGGMGTVRRLYDQVLRREVAMKVSDPSMPEYQQAAVRFVQEAQVTGQLDHPNIVPVHDLAASSEGSGFSFTMKLVDGQTLTRVFERFRAEPLSDGTIEQALQIFIKVCDAVSFAHSRGVVHRDLKPDNVMVGSHGQVYVMDWGAAKLLEEGRFSGGQRVTLSRDLFESEEQGAIVGTFEYMAPEQAWGRTDDVDERTDVFGLGGILYHLLTGSGPNVADAPYRALQIAQRGRPRPPEGRGAWRDLPPGLCNIAMKALAANPTNRYQTVQELSSDVSDFLRGGGWFETAVFAPGQVIVRQGEPGDSSYIIVRGTCDVIKEQGADRHLLRHLGPGDVFGETAVLTGEARTATVVATEEVTVKVVTRTALERELGRQSWGGAFVTALAERFRDIDEKLAELRVSSSPADPGESE